MLSPELLHLVAERYGLQAQNPQTLGGSFNLNLRLDGHVVRVYGPWVSPVRLRVLQEMRQTLRARGVPIPQLRPARDGAQHCAFGNCVLEVERYVCGAPMNSDERLRAGMRVLGQLHTHMADHQPSVPPPFANHLPQEVALKATLDATAMVRSWGPTPVEERLARDAELLAQRLPVVDLPCQWVHGDFWNNNVRFRNLDVAAVLDFDFAGLRPRVDDLALPLTYTLQNGADLAEIRTLVDAYDAGCAVPLSRQERQALPFAMARMALCFLQYLLIPGDPTEKERSRQEFRDRRGPACAWWLRLLEEGTLDETTFV